MYSAKPLPYKKPSFLRGNVSGDREGKAPIVLMPAGSAGSRDGLGRAQAVKKFFLGSASVTLRMVACYRSSPEQVPAKA
jgi:hypothetical protein